MYPDRITEMRHSYDHPREWHEYANAVITMGRYEQSYYWQYGREPRMAPIEIAHQLAIFEDHTRRAQNRWRSLYITTQPESHFSKADAIEAATRAAYFYGRPYEVLYLAGRWYTEPFDRSLARFGEREVYAQDGTQHTVVTHKVLEVDAHEV